jgi:hypothetical protein
MSGKNKRGKAPAFLCTPGLLPRPLTSPLPARGERAADAVGKREEPGWSDSQRFTNFAHQLVDIRIGDCFPRGLQPHDGIARAKPQAVAGGKFQPPIGKFVREGRAQRRLDFRQQGASASLGVAAGADADEEAGWLSDAAHCGGKRIAWSVKSAFT